MWKLPYPSPDASKIMLHILNHHIRYYIDWQIPQEQAGFINGALNLSLWSWDIDSEISWLHAAGIDALDMWGWRKMLRIP